ncbi:MAG: YggS family pyridoxal phosphate-dependent enzyme [Polyangiaceae bacterium]
MEPESIGARLTLIRERVERAAHGRRVTLVAVSKGHPASAIREAYAAGQRIFGENYAQELADKARELADLADLEWHFIGGLQRNKVKLIAGVARLIHTVDRAELGAEISKRSAREQAVLIEVNIGGEPQKAGCSPEDTAALARALGAMERVRLAGLMAIPPADDAEENRRHFAALAKLGAELRAAALLPEDFELSMGMSDDFEVALAEGATLVRVGTAIFGPRPARTSTVL